MEEEIGVVPGIDVALDGFQLPEVPLGRETEDVLYVLVHCFIFLGCRRGKGVSRQEGWQTF